MRKNFRFGDLRTSAPVNLASVTWATEFSHNSIHNAAMPDEVMGFPLKALIIVEGDGFGELKRA